MIAYGLVQPYRLYLLPYYEYACPDWLMVRTEVMDSASVYSILEKRPVRSVQQVERKRAREEYKTGLEERQIEGEAIKRKSVYFYCCLAYKLKRRCGELIALFIKCRI